jgi:uncharacterized membrane protein
MISDITFIGWVHSIIGLAAIGAGLWSLIRYQFIHIDKPVGQFYLWTTFITCLSSMLIYNATGGFNVAHLLSIATMLMIIYAIVVHKYISHVFFKHYTKHLALTGTVYFSLIPTTGEVLTRWPGSKVTGIDDPLIVSTLMIFTIIFFVLSIYQQYKIYTS